MLLRMYLRWAERNKYRTEILDQTEGEEAGLKSVTVAIDGRWAYGRLRSERGVHRLVRISPFDSQKRRHTSFALVEVMRGRGVVAEDAAIEIDEKDLRVDTYRASGEGASTSQGRLRGAHHAPADGILSRARTSGAPIQNRERAMTVLRAKLAEREAEEARDRDGAAGGQHVEAGWGNQIRQLRPQP
jgi:peptide chain release factor 2